MAVERSFLDLAEKAYQRLELLTGRKLDVATLGPKIRIYVAHFQGPSHVWGGYGHPQDPRGIIFLNRRAYEGAMRGANATYAHEMAHLFTWRYSSHTLREGFADYLALEIHPGAAVGPHAGRADTLPIAPVIADYLGTTRPPPPEVTATEHFRRMYYVAGYRFVNFLIARGGMETFLKLYDSSDPEAEYARLYGASRAELVRMANL
ncbi:MAG TPA: hypothetical protein VGJ74_19175 [Burkholderiales bacterium]